MNNFIKEYDKVVCMFSVGEFVYDSSINSCFLILSFYNQERYCVYDFLLKRTTTIGISYLEHFYKRV